MEEDLKELLNDFMESCKEINNKIEQGLEE